MGKNVGHSLTRSPRKPGQLSGVTLGKSGAGNRYSAAKPIGHRKFLRPLPALFATLDFALLQGEIIMIRYTAIAAVLLGFPTALPAQDDYSASEVVVTASRREADDYSEAVPLIGLRRLADFAIQPVSVEGDTRDLGPRRAEIFAMIKGAIELAGKREGIELATGEMVVEPLTLSNYKNLPMGSGGRPDTDRTRFLVKTRLKPGTDTKAALERISAFIKAVPAVGRAQLTAVGDLTLSVIGPDQYRSQVIDLVVADAKTVSAKLGVDYGVEVTGLDRAVEWSRATLTDVLLYVPYRYVVTPKR
jgi:hypothetical protein